ncbi:MAG TPA: DUF6356 family protein [Sphingomonas sp.]|jgi:hypothetical protein|uniref:DUF6356 family protein n=1 Tax=Sphingomonas sp. TaxID=28214 RepID=UPI002ED84133
MIRKLFLDHPDEVGETYAVHAATAGRFGAEMVAGGVACMIHAVVPAWFGTAGSGTVSRLHARMVAKRGAVRADRAQVKTVEYVI